MRIPFLGGIGVLELVIILVVVLLIFGPKNLPKLGNAIGRTFKSLRDGMDGKKKDGDSADGEAKVVDNETEQTAPSEEPVEEAESPKSSDKPE